ncbi:MAG: chitobiase/beta-hexosaminidase C-terminal domain-containing protein, partial [Verrucomicrobiales bacterium]|nr:chitobiase/beta-hexosaminidase C-terminal domain-containing protein [Verrucomicrobiales bacterium]
MFLERPILLSSNLVRLVVSGPTTNIQYHLYGTNDVRASRSTWPLLVVGQTNQVIFDLTMPWADAGFFVVTSNYVAGTNPPPQVATPVFTPPSASGNASIEVTVTCDTPGAVIYYTTDGSTPTTAAPYIPSGGKLTIQCATTLKARAFRSGFEPSAVATGVYAVNCPPMVFAGTQQIISGGTTTLAGWVWDDGLSQPLSNWWQKIGGPGTVSFANVNATNTTATFSADGIYVLQLNAFDGFWTRSNRVTIARNPALSVALTAPAASSTFSVPTNLVLAASTNGSSVVVTQVQFYAGSTLIGTDTESPFTYEWRNVPAGNHALYAMAFSTDPNHFSLLSDPVNITVNFPTDLGRFTLAATDLTIPTAGLPITIQRSHDPRHGGGWSLGQNMRLDWESVQLEKSGSLAVGWTGTSSTISHCMLESAPHLVTVRLSESEHYYFAPKFVFTSSGTQCKNSAQPPNCYNFHTIRLEFVPLGRELGGLIVSDPEQNVGMDDSLDGWPGPITPVFFDEFGQPLSAYDPDPSQFTFTAPDGTQYKFDSGGRLYQRIDRNGNTLTYDANGITWHHADTPWITKQVAFTRDAQGRITEIYDPIALETSGPPAVRYAYDPNGNLTNVARLVHRAGSGTYEHTAYRYDDPAHPHLITRVMDARGITTVSNVFDSFGRLIRQYDALGRYTSFAYEDNGRRQIVTDRNGRTTRQDFTEAGQLGALRDAEGAETRYEYDANGRLLAQVNPLGGTNAFAYNERDEVIGQTNELGHAAAAEYNAFGQPLYTIDPRGFGTTNVYDDRGNLLFVTNALGIVHAYGYDALGNRIAETNALGRPEQTVTLYAYNEFGWLTNLTDARGFSTAYTYDANGNQQTIRRERTLPGGGTQVLWTTNLYDAQNRVIAVIEPDGLTHRTVFNPIGQIAFTTNKLGVVTRYDYDPRGLLTNTVFALGTPQQVSEAAAYDPEGRRTNSVDRAGRVTRYTYDGVGRLLRTTFPDGAWVENQYDVAGRLYATLQGPRPDGSVQPPPSPRTTRYEYDAAGRRVAVIDALHHTNRYAYDANGNQTAFVDALGRTNLYTYDALNRQTQITYPDGTSER